MPPERDYTKTTDYHEVHDEATIAAMKDIRTQHRDLIRAITQVAPDCRERSIAITHLEESCMRTIQALAIYSPGAIRHES